MSWNSNPAWANLTVLGSQHAISGNKMFSTSFKNNTSPKYSLFVTTKCKYITITEFKTLFYCLYTEAICKLPHQSNLHIKYRNTCNE